MLGGYMGGQDLAARVVGLVIASNSDNGDGCLTSSCLGGEAGDSGDF